MEITILVALIALNALLALSETALVAARRSRLERMAENGDGAARTALELNEEPRRFLSTIQVGITSIGILSGIVGQALLADPFAAWLQELGAAPRTSELGATAIVVIALTYVTIVVGELVPKHIGSASPEDIARLVAAPVKALETLSRPAVYLLSISTAAVLKLFGQSERRDTRLTEEEIHAMLAQGSEAGVIDKSEHDMVRNVFRLDERQIASLMVPRADIVWLDVNRPLQHNLTVVAESEHSRFPVCRGGANDILGVIGTKQILNQSMRGEPVDLEQALQPAVYVPESLTGMELLERFRASDTHMVFVVDEYGEVEGIVTLYDLIESVTGEFALGDTEEAWAVQREDGSWLLDGLIPVPELKDRLELRSVPDEDRGQYNTLSGMMMWLLGRLPATGEIATWEGWRLEVVDLDGKRIDKVLASRLPAPAPEADSAEAPAAAPTSD